MPCTMILRPLAVDEVNEEHFDMRITAADMRITAWRDHAPAIEAPRQHQSLALVVEHGCIGSIPQKQQQEQQPMQE